ncbi:Ammonium transporter Rh type B [Galemys pyrenaicus]|uniref:Ammonium transporter Rh type B n=1 Tax=Galemys pyrenaicus TaxID=202257 RepID=A0A8J6AJP9_GALPY|nr:Ammonium transporter Rh type B [Galemys pyrenaicus]
MAGSSRRAASRRLQLPLLCLLLQGATAILFAVFVRYNHETDAALWHWGNHSTADNEFYFRYPSFQDVHTMVFVGFGFLMAFLQRYGFSSVGFTFLLAAFALQWATLVQGFFHSFHGGHIHVGVESMINADFCAGAVLISFGAVLGKTGPAQLLLMALLEVVLFGVNEFVLLSLLGVRDAGGSMTIHTFGAYFGLVLSRVLYRPQLDKSKHRQGSVYHSDLFAMIGEACCSGVGGGPCVSAARLPARGHTARLASVFSGPCVSAARLPARGHTARLASDFSGPCPPPRGHAGRLEQATRVRLHGGRPGAASPHSAAARHLGTIFLWIFWPSFNSAPTTLGDGQHRTALNTYYSLTASTLSTFALSALVGGDGRLDMVHIQNAALAGGVVVGTAGEMMLTPFGALAAGFLAGTVSTLGYKFFTPILESKFKVQDTCGIHNLHGVPGVLGAFLGALVAWLATHEAYGGGLETVFPLIAKGERSAKSQAVYQLFGLFVTLMFASVGGGVGGLLLKLPFLGSPPDSQCYEDQIYWEVSGTCVPSSLGALPSLCLLPPLPAHTSLERPPSLDATLAFQVPGEHEDETQGPLRAEEPDTRA